MTAKILIVEDEILVGMMLKKKIEKHGYVVDDIATSGEEAIEMAESGNPDLLFMDVSLPGSLDGVDTAIKIKEKRDIPVIFFTGNHRDENLIRRSEKVKPVAILDKMGSFAEVICSMQKALSSSNASGKDKLSSSA
ncbi:MAG: response regulator [Desulforhopalus sp.]